MWVKLLTNGGYDGCDGCVGKKFNVKRLHAAVSILGKQLIKAGANQDAFIIDHRYTFIEKDYEKVTKEAK